MSKGSSIWTLAIHGGAGTIPHEEMTGEKKDAYLNGLRAALDAGRGILASGGTALDAVCAAVVSMEDSPLFNAGKGSVYTFDGTHEMDASVMNGIDRHAGAVAGISGVKNPILLSRAVMEKSDHVFLSGKGAEEFARSQGIVFESEEYFHDPVRFEQWRSVAGTNSYMLDHSQTKKFSTVGAVARDKHGHLASATSTGGMTNKRFGRIGDTPVIASGTWADNNTCAVSCTGHGEYFLRWVVAYDVACLMEYKGLSLEEACKTVVQNKLRPNGGEGGLIAVDPLGNIALEFNSDGMYRGSCSDRSEPSVLIWRD